MLDLTKTKALPKESTLEDLISKLDSRGLLVLQVLIGQQAMQLLALEKLDATVSSILKPSTQGTPWQSIKTVK